MPARLIWKKSSAKPSRKLGWMYELEVQHRARRDLKEIWSDSFKSWNEKQADRYLRDLNAKLVKLKLNPNLGRARDELRPGYRSLAINRHVVYYTVEEPVVRIIRVLHGRMDPDQHL
jgi:toxin ParE1/3/4